MLSITKELCVYVYVYVCICVWAPQGRGMFIFLWNKMRYYVEAEVLFCFQVIIEFLFKYSGSKQIHWSSIFTSSISLQWQSKNAVMNGYVLYLYILTKLWATNALFAWAHTTPICHCSTQTTWIYMWKWQMRTYNLNVCVCVCMYVCMYVCM